MVKILTKFGGCSILNVYIALENAFLMSKQNLIVSRRVVFKIQNSQLLSCKQGSCPVFCLHWFNIAVKVLFQANFFLF